MTGANFWSLLGSRNMLYKYFFVCLFVRKQAGGQDFQGPALGIVKRYVLSYISYIISYREVSVCLFVLCSLIQWRNILFYLVRYILLDVIVYSVLLDGTVQYTIVQVVLGSTILKIVVQCICSIQWTQDVWQVLFVQCLQCVLCM